MAEKYVLLGARSADYDPYEQLGNYLETLEEVEQKIKEYAFACPSAVFQLFEITKRIPIRVSWSEPEVTMGSDE